MQAGVQVALAAAAEIEPVSAAGYLVGIAFRDRYASRRVAVLNNPQMRADRLERTTVLGACPAAFGEQEYIGQDFRRLIVAVSEAAAGTASIEDDIRVPHFAEKALVLFCQVFRVDLSDSALAAEE